MNRELCCGRGGVFAYLSKDRLLAFGAALHGRPAYVGFSIYIGTLTFGGCVVLRKRRLNV